MIDKNIITLLELVKENPDLEVIPAVYYEMGCEDLIAKIKSVAIDYFYVTNDRWYAGKDEIINRIANSFLYNSNEYDGMDDDQFYKEVVNKEFDKLVATGKIKKAIIMYIGLP